MKSPIWLKLGLVSGLILLVLWVDLRLYLNTPISLPTNTVNIVLTPGEHAKEFLSNLSQKIQINRPNYFALWLRFSAQDRFLKAGEYEFSSSITPNALIQKLISGNVKRYKVTAIEGWEVNAFFKLLKTAPSLQLDLDLTCQKCLKQLLAIQYKTLEGLFFPSTYYYTANTKVSQIIHRAHTALLTQLNTAFENRAANLPYKNAYEALISASLIEKEASVPTERAMVSGVILRRLEKGMRLQIDASVRYGLKKPSKVRLRKEDLKKDTPYNTYLHKGLPPTPIALVSKSALQAALHPDTSGYLYFVSKNDGTHHFSKTLAEHNEAVKKFQKN